MRIPPNAAIDTAILQYSQFSDSPASSGRSKALKINTGEAGKPETYSRPEIKISTPEKPVIDTSRFQGRGINQYQQTNSDGDMIDLDFSRIQRFVERFGWDKVPPENLRGIEYFREKSITIYNQDGDRLDINYRAAVGQQAARFGDSLTQRADSLEPMTGCSACESRRYVDKSNDSSVSYQTPTNLNPQTAAVAIASHEREHVTNEQARAQRENREIVDQTVTIQYSTCPECNTMYPSGGTTRTTSISKSEDESASPPAQLNGTQDQE